jgi:succinate dehydrogenase / fumarate reductase, iron-sulfur subunit
MQIKFRVFRFNPERDKNPHFDTFIMEVDPNDRILDLLEQVRADFDGSLAIRRSCAHGVCGSDAMRINGRNALACKALVKTLNTDTITVEPLLGLKVIKDLIVDMGPFFESYRSVMPFLVNDDPLPADGKERLQTPQQQERFQDTTKCILCAACTTSCPSFWADTKYVGPAAIVNAHRFIFDSRDKAASKRLGVLNQEIGVWRCRTAFNCTEACPREIHITQAIAEVKKALVTGKVE